MDNPNNSFMEREPAADLGSIIAEMGSADGLFTANNPVKKLADMFNTCATKGNEEGARSSEDGMKVYLRVRPCNKPETTILVESDTSIVTTAPESSKRALYTKTESRHYVSDL